MSQQEQSVHACVEGTKLQKCILSHSEVSRKHINTGPG